MKAKLFGMALIATALFTACGGDDHKADDAAEVADAPAAAVVYSIVPTESKVEWVGKKVTGQHNGHINIKSGELDVQGDDIVAGSFVIDMNTITVDDLAAGEGKEDLEGHLKGMSDDNASDFFNVREYPEAKFAVTKVEAANGTNVTHNIYGNLTMRGVTKEVMIPVSVMMGSDMIKATGSTMIDRTEWDIKYGSGKFFEDLGDKTINDDFEIKLDITAKKSA